MNQDEFKLGKDALVISIMTLITVFCWIGFEVYRAYTKPTVPRILIELIKPLDANIDRTILEDIKQKYQPSEGELNVSAPVAPPPAEELEEE